MWRLFLSIVYEFYFVFQLSAKLVAIRNMVDATTRENASKYSLLLTNTNIRIHDTHNHWYRSTSGRLRRSFGPSLSKYKTSPWGHNGLPSMTIHENKFLIRYAIKQPYRMYGVLYDSHLKRLRADTDIYLWLIMRLFLKKYSLC